MQFFEEVKSLKDLCAEKFINNHYLMAELESADITDNLKNNLKYSLLNYIKKEKLPLIKEALSKDSHFKNPEVRATEHSYSLYDLGADVYVIKEIIDAFNPITLELAYKDVNVVNVFYLKGVVMNNEVYLELEGTDNASLGKYLDDKTITEINKHIKDPIPILRPLHFHPRIGF